MTRPSLAYPALLLVTSCAADAGYDPPSNGAPDRDAPSSAPAESAASAAPPPGSEPSTSPLAPGSATPGPAASASAGSGTCVMWYACGCNVGCSKIAEPRSALRSGLEVAVVSGTSAGKKGFVHESKDKDGKTVFSLSHHEPGKPSVCALPDPRYMGYACETSKSGELRAHACDDACR